MNRLHDLLCEREVVLINPTAIDELRYGNNPRTYRRNPRLTRRWPQPDGELISSPVTTPPEHSDILVGDLSDDDEMASHAARSLSIQISSDVAFRDHFIVENTPNLCIFRPFHCEPTVQPPSRPEWSGGVVAELNHWMRCVQDDPAEGPSESSHDRRIAFVHTRSEMKNRLRHVAIDDSGNFKQNILTHAPGADSLAMARDPGASSLLDTGQGSQAAISTPGAFRESLDAAALIACHFAFTRMMREEPPEYALLIAVDESTDRRVDGMHDLASVLKQFFGNELPKGELGSINASFLDTCRSIFVEVTGLELLLYALQTVGMDTPRTRSLMDIDEPVA